MASFYIDLNEISSKKTRITRLLILGAAVCAVFIAASIYIFLRFKSSLEWVFLSSAIYTAIYFYFAWITYKTKLFVKADSSGVNFKFGLRSSSKNYILWDSVSNVKIGYAYITFNKKSGRRRKIQLNWLPYTKVVEIKERLIEMCEDRRIKYQKVYFIDYSKKKDTKKE